MCSRPQPFLNSEPSLQRISKLDSASAALKAKNDARAFAILRAIAASQVAPSPSLADYPALAKLLREKRNDRAARRESNRSRI